MKKNKEINNEVKKKRVKGVKTRIFAKIIATIIALMMVVAACSSVLYAIIYNN